MTGHASTRGFSIIFTISGSVRSRDVLNQRLLPGDYYALAEQQGAGFEPDVLTLKRAERPSRTTTRRKRP